MRLVFSLILPVLFLSENFAQNNSHSEFIFGYGFYEGFNIGKTFYFRNGTHSAGFTIGYDKLMKQKNLAATMSYEIAILQSKLNMSNHYKWHVSSKAVLWQLEDAHYMWRAVSIIPSISRRFSVGKRLDISVDTGPSFNIVLYSKRKTFEEVGWPYHVMPDFRILFIL